MVQKQTKPKSTKPKQPRVTTYAALDSRGALLGVAPFKGLTPGEAMCKVLNSEWIEAKQDLDRLRSATLSEDAAEALFRALGWTLVKATKNHLNRYPGQSR